MSVSHEINALISMVNTEDIENNSPIQKRINQLLNLEEELSKALN
jgi:hypothetical protein